MLGVVSLTWGSKEWTLTRPSVAPDYQTAIAAIRATTLRRRTGPNQPGTAVAHGHHYKRQKALDGPNVWFDLDPAKFLQTNCPSFCSFHATQTHR